MNNKLKELFPMIQEREEILKKIQESKELSKTFYSWSEANREEFLNLCTGEKGVKILYDSFFKEIFNPEYSPERLNTLLSLLIGETVTIITVLPNDSTRIGMESSLLITDITVKLTDGTLANIEIQKIGYMFPGERAACYSADLLLRQYKKVRSERYENFSYRNIKTVYTIVLFEESPKIFQKFPDRYIHRFEQTSDTGLRIELLQKYIFVGLDIFRNIHKNIDVSNELDAWLTFLSFDEPEIIARLTSAYPKFIAMYKDIYNVCRNTEKVMNMFSEELKILDRNTVQYMIDSMKEELEDKKRLLEKLTAERDSIREEIDRTIAERDGVIAEKEDMIAERDGVIAEKEQEIERLKALLAKK